MIFHGETTIRRIITISTSSLILLITRYYPDELGDTNAPPSKTRASTNHYPPSYNINLVVFAVNALKPQTVNFQGDACRTKAVVRQYKHHIVVHF